MSYRGRDEAVDERVADYGMVIMDKRGNHRHIDKAMEGIMPGIERPYDAARLPLSFPLFDRDFLSDFQKSR